MYIKHDNRHITSVLLQDKSINMYQILSQYLKRQLKKVSENQVDGHCVDRQTDWQTESKTYSPLECNW